jgi:hypothetical protein
VLADVREQVVALAVVNKSESSASAAEATGATDTVQVSLIVCCTTGQVGNVVVDNHGDGLDVDTARQDVGRNEYLCLASAELVEDIISLSSVQGAGKGSDLVAIGSHASLDLCGGVAALDEDDGRGDGHQTVELQQCGILRLIGIAVEILCARLVIGSTIVLRGDIPSA